MARHEKSKQIEFTWKLFFFYATTNYEVEFNGEIHFSEGNLMGNRIFALIP